MDEIAQLYVRLTLAIGQHDPHYVDAYYGPPEWKESAELGKKPLDRIKEESIAARESLERFKPYPSAEPTNLRWHYLAKQLEAQVARIDILSGKTLSFDEESSALYDVVAPCRPDSFYAAVIAKLEAFLPGKGSLFDRYNRLKAEFTIPPARLDGVFRASIQAAKERTRRYLVLPDSEDFRLEYVTNQVWGGYNWFKGDAQSLIQVNTDFPIEISRALSLACHEGYPGHHVYNALLEKHLLRERQWVEFSVYALFSPHSLIAEGTAEYGVDLTFTPEERLAFERETLFPLAGLDPIRAPEYHRLMELVSDLGYASTDAARRYLDGNATKTETKDWLVEYGLSSPDRAQQGIGFIEANRSYVVTYVVGKELVKDYVEARGKTEAERWQVFADLLSSPRCPSGLRDGLKLH